jgi:reactive intermediate/imine deaminase
MAGILASLSHFAQSVRARGGLVTEKEAILTTRAPKPGGIYSQAVKTSGGFLFTAGLGPMDAATNQVVGTTVEEQTRQVLSNLRAIVEDAGLTMDQVVKTTVYLQHLERDFAAFNQVYSEFFNPPYPVRTTVGADLNKILVEIDLVAALN